jgi:tetratricopeptide (TPR) repeat protein
MARAVVEVFADNVSELSLDNRLLKHFTDSGWTIDRVDQWLASRPKGVKGFWVKERLRFNTHHGRGEALERELAERVRANSKDITEAVVFLDGLALAHAGRQEKPDLAWIVETIKPELATDATEIASRLVTLENWKTAAEFYRQAIATSLTDEEVKRLAMMYQVFMPETNIRASFAAHTREGLADCLLKMEQAGEAQKWMLEASDIREKNHLGRNALFAGQVQDASGQRVIEGQMKAEEQASAMDPKYWYERAQYYRGRREATQEQNALTKGLALTTPQPEPEQRTKGYMDWRSRLLADYAHFLAREKREEEAVVLLRKEIAESPANSESSTRAANMLAFDFEKQLRVDDAVLWNWLKNRPKWEYTEERLLWRMLEKANRNDLDGHFSRAEKLASGNDPSRAHTLGWIENRMAFPKRSIPLLEYAVKKAQDKELKDRAVFSLFESYLDTGDWQCAEAVFPDASQRLTPKELPDWYSRIAVLAAKAGAKADAMRIWSRVANLDLSATSAIEQLVTAGLRNELIGFYRDMQKMIPSSEIPEKVLGTLGIHDANKPDPGDGK